MRWASWSMLLLAACASSAGSTTEPSDVPGAGGPAPTVTQPAVVDTTVPSTGGSADTAAPGITAVSEVTVPAVVPEGFATTQAVVTKADGTTCEVCLWLADTSEQRARGLMFATDLGRADGMAFRYEDQHTGSFWMKSTVLPLSIAFFAPGGSYLEAFDMEPCPTDSCPRYGTPNDFLVAVEVLQGDLERLGLVAGSTLELLDLPCDG